MLISSHWDTVTRHLTPPGIAWEWSECGLSHRVKTIFKDRGLIHRASGGDRWETSMAMWCYVIDTAGDDETIGAEATGQETLDAPPAAGESRLAANTNTVPDAIGGSTQSTLAGDTITDTTDTEEEIRKPWLKDPTSSKPTPMELAANHPSQARLDVWTREDCIDRWDVDTSRSESEVLLQPEGRVYYPADSPATVDGQATLTAFAPRQWGVTATG